MDLTKEDKKKIKLAIECIEEYRRKHYASGNAIFRQYQDQTFIKDYEKYQVLSDTIDLLKSWL